METDTKPVVIPTMPISVDASRQQTKILTRPRSALR